MKTKPITPYARLLNTLREYVDDVNNRHTRRMFLYPKGRLAEGWELGTIYARVVAADQLGYDVQLKATQEGLDVEYIKKLPNAPWEAL